MGSIARSTELTAAHAGTLSSRVYTELRALVRQGAFSPGEALPIRTLALAFGVSPTPVREALQQLVAEGIVVAAPNRSFRIGELTAEQFADLREVRLSLEGLAAERAARRMTPDILAELEDHNRGMLRAAEEHRGEDYLSLNEAFHFAVYRAAGSDVILQMLDVIWLRVGPYLRQLLADISMRDAFSGYHEEIIAALARGDAAAAAEAIRADIVGSAEEIARLGRAAPALAPREVAGLRNGEGLLDVATREVKR
jgi:DNA-binding GntR family transcriptional regulator